MRRLAVVLTAVLAGVLGVFWVAAPASAFGHGAVTNPYAHAAFDILVPLAVTAPLWTAYLWGRDRRRLLLALVAVVQLPVAVVGFLPVINPVANLAALIAGLAVTTCALMYARRSATAPAAATESS